MNKNMLMILGGAAVVAVLVALVVQAMLSPTGGTPQQTASVEILVANKKLVTGEKLKPEDVRWQAWPETAVFKGVYKRSEQPDEKKLSVYDAPLRRSVESGEPVTTQALIPDVKGGSNFLAASISPGMRGVAIAVKPQSAVGGFVAAGDYVDVILTYSPKLKGDVSDYALEVAQRYASQTVLSNVKVLAVDQSAKEEAREAKISKTVTLEVTKEGGEVLNLAEMMGDLSLALRHIGDQDTPGDAVTPITTDVIASEVIMKATSLMNDSASKSNTVRVYSGSTIQNIPVRAVAGP
jgi:pilus assembly protein CpaB